MRSSANTWAVIVAAGVGERFGTDQPKQFARLGGKPLVLWSIETFHGHPSMLGVTVVVPPVVVAEPPEWLANLAATGVAVVAGGPQRTDSVRLGLESVPPEVEYVAVHDGARPLIDAEAISAVLAKAAPRNGAVAARRVTDSLKEADQDGRILKAVDRERLWHAETPQIFPRDLIVALHRDAYAEGIHESDCAALCERYGVQVVVAEISRPNPKVTHREDLDLLEAMIRRYERASDPQRG
jgi:2-C-methyl-D-erythritol 4-phosphate cytidylyltransferase